MRTGIIGLPQTGKTSLFHILTRARVDPRAAHGQTHVGIARVPDSRLDQLARIFQPRKTTYAAIEFVDVGGLVHDRAKDSAYLVQLREADALVHVVRMFEDPALPIPGGKLDAARDIESVELDLILNDLEQVTRRLERLERDLKKRKDSLLEIEHALLLRCKAALESEQPLRQLDFKPEEQKVLTGFMFLSQKALLVALNFGDEEAARLDRAVESHGLAQWSAKPRTAIVSFCGKIEAELADLPDAEARELMIGYGLSQSGRDRLIQASYRLLGLISFLTCGEPECRAWTIPRGTTAVKAAGTIHTDIEHHFIKAEVMNWEHLLAAGSWAGAKEKGQVRLEGKEYVVAEGDVILFRHAG